MSKNNYNFVGSDVSAENLIVELRLSINDSYKQGEFENTVDGHKKLIKWVTKDGAIVRICMESTGVYHLKLATLLAEHKKTEVMVVNAHRLYLKQSQVSYRYSAI